MGKNLGCGGEVIRYTYFLKMVQCINSWANGMKRGDPSTGNRFSRWGVLK